MDQRYLELIKWAIELRDCHIGYPPPQRHSMLKLCHTQPHIQSRHKDGHLNHAGATEERH